ncbi:hypothetical protein BJ138DRAFT_1017220, partial [Hygrophoropsis aurantiaca]
FVGRGFAHAEISDCRAQASPLSSSTAYWVNKEAGFKSLGAAVAMKDIEILLGETSVPTITLHGKALLTVRGSSRSYSP